MISVILVLYILLMLVLLFVGSTILGIATLGLYIYGRTGTLPVIPGEKIPAGEFL